MKELDLEADAFECEKETADYPGGNAGTAEDSHFARQADALVQMARGYLAGGKGKKSSSADHYQVMGHAAAVAVDEEVLRHASTETSKSDLPSETVRRLCCDSGLVVITKNQNGDPLNVSRRHRVVQPR